MIAVGRCCCCCCCRCCCRCCAAVHSSNAADASWRGVAAAVVALAVASVITTGDSPVHAAYLTLLDLLAMGDPAVEDTDTDSRQIIQLLSGMAGLLLLPLL